jgi:cytidylate kinase
MIVAIDGPAGSGKGTLARKLSIFLGVPHLDSGKLYRYVALVADDLRIDPVIENLGTSDLDNPRLSSGRAGVLAAKYSKSPAVREKVTNLIREFSMKSHGCVVDGRDIGTIVLPNADLKLYVTASPETRARRRVAELHSIGHEASLEVILVELLERDRADMERKIAPLLPAPDAHLLDTTHLDIDAAFRAAVDIVEAVRTGREHGRPRSRHGG